MKTLVGILTVSATAMAMALPVGAATVDVKFDSPIFNGSGSDNVYITYPGASQVHVAAGRFQGEVTGHSADVNESIFVDSVNDLFMYCYDVYETIGGGRNITYTINLSGPTTRTLDFLGAVNSVLNDGAATYDPFAWLRPADGWIGAAIQIGIWESKYDTSATWSVLGGSFTASGLESSTGEWLSKFFTAMPGASSLEAKFAMTLEARGAQDMITGDPNPVPEPASLALLGIGLAGLGFSRRKTS